MNPLPMKDQNKQKINQAHDAYGKASLSRKEVAIDFLKGHLPKELVDMIDLDSLELTKGDFTDDFFQYHNDVTYKAKIDNEEGLIYFSIELQLKPEKLMAFRMLCYLVLILKTYLQQNKHAKDLPLVLPICLYNGKVKYPFSTSMYDCFKKAAIARKFKLLEQFMLLDLNNFSREALLKHGVSALFQTLYKESHTGDFIGLVQEFSSEFLSSFDSSYIYSSGRYMIDQSGENTGEQAVKLFSQAINNEDTRRLFMTYSDKLRQQGMQQEKLGIAKNMLGKGYTYDVIKELTGLELKQIEKLFQKYFQK